MIDPGDLRDKGVESLAAGLAQIKHLRHHQKENLNDNAKSVLDKHIDALTSAVTDLADLALVK